MSFLSLLSPLFLKKGFVLYLHNNKTSLSRVWLYPFWKQFFVVIYRKRIHYIQSGTRDPILQTLNRIFNFKPSSNDIGFQGTISVITVNPMQVLSLGTIKIISYFQQKLSLIQLSSIQQNMLELIKTSTTVILPLINNTTDPDKLFSLKVFFSLSPNCKGTFLQQFTNTILPLIPLLLCHRKDTIKTLSLIVT